MKSRIDDDSPPDRRTAARSRWLLPFRRACGVLGESGPLADLLEILNVAAVMMRGNLADWWGGGVVSRIYNAIDFWLMSLRNKVS